MGQLREALRRGSIRVLSRLGLPPRTAFDYRNATANDRWIVEYVFPGKREGFFLEAGAANGRDASSCYVLETELGWKGICIEPHDAFYRELVENRPASHCEQLCLTGGADWVVYKEGDASSHLAYLSGIEANLRSSKSNAWEILDAGLRVQKPGETLASVLDRCAAPDVIEYGAFDIEGSELDVLKVFPFERYRFLALSLECDWKIWDPITQLLRSRNYKEVRNPFNRKAPWERYWLHGSIA